MPGVTPFGEDCDCYYSGATGCFETPGLSLAAAIRGSACDSPAPKDVFVLSKRLAAATAAGYS